MNRKEIVEAVRFANRVHDSFENADLSLVEHRQMIDTIERQIHVLTLKAKYRGHSRLSYDDYWLLASTSDRLSRRLRRFIHPESLFRGIAQIPFRTLANNVKSLVLHGAQIELNRASYKIVIPVSPFSLVDPNGESWPFEDLNIEFWVDHSRRGLHVGVSGPDYEDQGYPHPHVSGNGSICMGDAQEMIENALKTCDIISAYDVIESLLRTYNPRSPYFHLEHINGERCSDCGEQDSDMCHCRRCAEPICGSCHANCGCGNMHEYGCYCSDCAPNCSECGETVCGGCQTECTHCGHVACDSCSRVCEDCGNTVCESCMTDCEHCDSGHLCPSCREENHNDCEEESA